MGKSPKKMGSVNQGDYELVFGEASWSMERSGDVEWIFPGRGVERWRKEVQREGCVKVVEEGGYGERVGAGSWSVESGGGGGQWPQRLL